MPNLLQPASLLPFFQWLEALPVSNAIRSTIWVYAVDESLHLVALAVLVGALLLVDLRLLGIGVRQQPLAQVAREAQPWLIGSLIVMAATGVPMVMDTAMKEFYSPFFWLKMEVLVVAVVYTFTIRRKVTLSDETRLGAVRPKVVAVVSIVLWASVAIPGRLIGLFS